MNPAFHEYDDRREYAEAQGQMIKYPEAFEVGRIIYKHRRNAGGVTYCIKLPSGCVMAGFAHYAEMQNGTSAEDYLRYLFNINTETGVK